MQYLILKHPKHIFWLLGFIVVPVILEMKSEGIEGLDLLKVCLAMSFLSLAAWIDKEKRVVPNKLLLAALAGRSALWILEFTLDREQFGQQLLQDLAGCGIVLLTLLALAAVTRNGIGMGDVKLLGVISLYDGISRTFHCFAYGIFLAAAVSVCLLALGKKRRKDRIALVPFFLMGYWLAMIL